VVRLLVLNIREEAEFIFGIPSIDDLFLTLTHEYISSSWLKFLTKELTKAGQLDQTLSTLLEAKVS
jgi:hypothetical protein